MKRIGIEKLFYKGHERLLLRFAYDKDLIEIVKRIENARWSSTLKCWHIENDEQSVKKLLRLMKGIAFVDTKEMLEMPEKAEVQKNKITQVKVNTELLEDKVKSEVLKFKYWMKQKRYSDNTITTYVDGLKIFFAFYCDKPIHKINNKDVVRFNNEYILANNYSVAYQSQIINAIKLFYSKNQEKEINLDKIDRPRKPHKLPNVLSKEEVAAILKAPNNIKHKAMLSLIYSCGLRRSELLNLKPTDVDSKRNLLIIRNAKGFKDRVAPLSDKIIEMLRNYYKEYKPKVWLFEGQKVQEQYSETSLQEVFKAATKKACIKRPATLHWLRHSYATHLLENGTDLRYIQEILGHKSSKTTEIYTHVTNKSLQKIKSPFDDLDI